MWRGRAGNGVATYSWAMATEKHTTETTLMLADVGITVTAAGRKRARARLAAARDRITRDGDARLRAQLGLPDNTTPVNA